MERQNRLEVLKTIKEHLIWLKNDDRNTDEFRKLILDTLIHLENATSYLAAEPPGVPNGK